MINWINDAVFYHIYPLGMLGAPKQNDLQSIPVNRISQLKDWIPHWKNLGVNALYLGPLFESSSHGYDTVDYFQIDRRLGTQDDLANLVNLLHENGIRVILDAVFNHVGREFRPFVDVRENLQNSRYGDWFHGLNFESRSPYDDPFTYESWSGYYSLVKLNLKNPEVKQYLIDAVDDWVKTYKIDGLRLDAADVIDKDFLRDLKTHCRDRYEEFWLMGEVVHGDYNHWANPDMLDSVTNYESQKGLYSSLVDKNYFEIAWTLNRQFGDQGLYKNLTLYNFVDNHDVDRAASRLTEPGHLYPLYILLFTMPGVPSIYYGSEWGMEGKRQPHSDAELRPSLSLEDVISAPQPDLAKAVSCMAKIRHDSAALKRGDYQQLHVAHEQLAFSRQSQEEQVIVLLNAASKPESIEITLPGMDKAVFEDVLNGGEFRVEQGMLKGCEVPAMWGRILRRK